ncbi:MAG: nucleotidyltransferase substrate binding protein [Holosporaceae bacterium]|jgi:nucleotidyltransferase substrate binding protein (TIGR01987 family)|nr:nucleotidyltransferase substrate binding protein [Holosporaceae bacterium]
MKINNLKLAFQTLEEGYKIYISNCDKSLSDMLADSCVKRFEYTIETSIKTMKKFLKEIYFVDEKDLTVNNIFRLMEGYGFISSWLQWKNYYQSRNNTTHEYNLSKSRELLNLIPQYIEDTAFLLRELQGKLDSNDD